MGITIDNKSDARQAIRNLENKGRQILLESGAGEAVNVILAATAARGWDEVSTAPKHVRFRAAYKGETHLEAKSKLINKENRLTKDFADLTKLRYNAFTEINALTNPTQEELLIVYEKHKLLFEAEYKTDPDASVA